MTIPAKRPALPAFIFSSTILEAMPFMLRQLARTAVGQNLVLSDQSPVSKNSLSHALNAYSEQVCHSTRPNQFCIAKCLFFVGRTYHKFVV